MTLLSFIVLIAVASLLAFFVAWGWYTHCLFFFHQWDKRKGLNDMCLRCGSIRFGSRP